MSVHGPFSSIDISNSGLGLNKIWMDAIADNIANVNTQTSPGQAPFRARIVVAVPLDTNTTAGGGVTVGQILQDGTDPALVQDPGSPLADAQGYVQNAVVDLSGQMGDLILASRTYQANMTVFKESRDALQTTVTLGRG